MTADPLAELLALSQEPMARTYPITMGAKVRPSHQREADWLRAHRTELLEALGGDQINDGDPGAERWEWPRRHEVWTFTGDTEGTR